MITRIGAETELDKYIASRQDKVRADNPFFRALSGKNFSGKDFNKELKALTSRITDGSNKIICILSFRAGVETDSKHSR